MSTGSANAKADIRQVLGLGRTSTSARLRWLVVLIVAVVIAAIARSAFTSSGDAVHYRTAEVRRGDLVVTVTATGTLQPTNKVEVGSELSGIIKAVTVSYNDRVEVDQVLAMLDTQKLEAQVLQSEALLKAAEAKVLEGQATVAETDRELKRAADLQPKRAMSEHDLVAAQAAFKRAEAALANAKAQVAVARATLEVDRTNLSKAVIRSPINGVVLERKVEPGQTVAAAMQTPVLFTLAEDLTQMELHVDVDEADVGQVARGQSATFTVDAYPDRHFQARITEVRYASKTVDGVVTYEAVLSVDNSQLLLRPGMTATADITVRKLDDALLVPNAALRFAPPALAEAQPASDRRGFLSRLVPHPPSPPARPTETAGAKQQQQKVWTLRDQQLVAIPITVGATDGRMTEVVAGEIQPGLQVVTDTVEVHG
jgi:HlyD family secretion protein